METVHCPLCEGEISATAKKCRHCGEWIARECLGCGTPIRNEWAARGCCADCEGRGGKERSLQTAAGPGPVTPYRPEKHQGAAVALALLLGGFGAHKFYLGRPWLGLLYIIFIWTMIPPIAGLVEGVLYATMTEEEFKRRYSRSDPEEFLDPF